MGECMLLVKRSLRGLLQPARAEVNRGHGAIVDKTCNSESATYVFSTERSAGTVPSPPLPSLPSVSPRSPPSVSHPRPPAAKSASSVT
jgi:hypothetical protein